MNTVKDVLAGKMATPFTLLFLGALLAFTTASCDTFSLDKDPIGEISGENFYQTEADAVAAINAVYSRAKEPQGGDFWTSIPWYGDFLSDDVIPRPGQRPAPLGDYSFTSTSRVLEDTWKGRYEGIFRANLVLANVPDIDMDEGMKERILGEAHFLRGWLYWRLGRIFGGVPLVTKPLEQGEFEQSAASQEAVFEQVRSDLQKAESRLPVSYSGSNVGRATKGAAKGYLAKLMMREEDWQGAADKIEELMSSSADYGLVEEYESLFNGTNENSKESLFEIQFATGTGEDVGNSFNCTRSPNEEGLVPCGGWGFARPSQDLVDAFDPGDPRFTETLALPGDTLEDFGVVYENVNNGGPAFIKYSIPNATGFMDAQNNWVALRYADILLLYAEALNQMGQTSQAAEYVNRVRERVGMPPVENGLSQQETFEAIRHERRVELAHETIRWYDLKRWGLLEEQVGALKEGFGPVNRIMPIPQPALDRNPCLTQNEGYGEPQSPRPGCSSSGGGGDG